jgi:hypothetical protein
MSRTCVKSNGLATHATLLTGSVSSPATDSSDMIPPRHQPDELHRRAAGVLAHPPDRGRDDVLDPVLEAEVAVGERDRAVLDEVGRMALAQQVLGHAVAAAQVEAERRRGERRDEQDRQPVELGRRGRAQVAEDRALRLLEDDPRRGGAQVGHPAARDLVEEVGGGVGDLCG